MRHFLSVNDFQKDEIETILNWATSIEKDWLCCRSMNNKCIASFFAEPSTRTRFSFERAMHWLGGRIITAANASQSSSLTKGESLKDTIRTLSQYSDCLVIRHPDPKWIDTARTYSRVPVINAGSGAGEHPTQALLDLHTIKQKYRIVRGLKVLLCGDLKNSRTIHSLVKLLCLYGCKIYYCSASVTCEENTYELDPPDELAQFANLQKIKIKDANDLLQEIDVVYMTRIQKERLHISNCEIEFFKLNKSNINLLNEKATILHPLPRNEEISEDIDEDPRADYHEKQVKNGLFVRTALLDYILYNNPIFNLSSFHFPAEKVL